MRLKIASNPLGNIQLFCQGAYDFFSYRVCCGLNDLICSKGSNDHISELGKAAGIHAMPEMKEVTIGPKQADGRHKYDPNVTLRNAITRFNASLEDEQLVERLAKHITHHMPPI